MRPVVGIAGREAHRYLPLRMTDGASRSSADLPVFVYGTLKAGFHNHASYCQGVTRVVPAETWGRLHVWQPGIPIMAVPRRKVLLLGSPDVADDLVRAEPLRIVLERGSAIVVQLERDGAPVDEFRLVALLRGDELVAVRSTDLSGQIRFRGLSAGTWSVSLFGDREGVSTVEVDGSARDYLVELSL